MIVRGPTWDWNLFKIETDAGVHGIGEGYWGPGAKDITLKRFREQLIGEDPINVVKLYTKLLFLNGGYGATGGLTYHAASGIEIALWDLAGRLLQTPVCNLLGGRFRDKVRFYRTLQAPEPNPGRSRILGPPGGGGRRPQSLRLHRLQVPGRLGAAPPPTRTSRSRAMTATPTS